MKTFVYLIVIVLLIAGGVWYFGGTGEIPPPSPLAGDNDSLANAPTSALADGEYRALISESAAYWTGSKTLIKDYYDTGTIALKSGTFTISDSTLANPIVVTFDMTSIAATKTGQGKGEDRLSEHLKSEDFFAVMKYPETRFISKEILTGEGGAITLQGDLEIKGVTAPITIPVMIAKEESGKLILSGKAAVDRTLWDLRYGSDKFFDNLGNNVINDIFTLEFRLVAEQNPS